MGGVGGIEHIHSLQTLRAHYTPHPWRKTIDVAAEVRPHCPPGRVTEAGDPALPVLLGHTAAQVSRTATAAPDLCGAALWPRPPPRPTSDAAAAVQALDAQHGAASAWVASAPPPTAAAPLAAIRRAPPLSC